MPEYFQKQHDDLDHFDELTRHLRPLEHLFQVMGAVGPGEDGAELVRGCAEIGTLLAAQLRASLRRIYRQDGGAEELE